MIKKYINPFFFCALLLIGIILSSCRKDEVISDANARLSFSEDTVYFDTVFTDVATPTYRLMVYNNNDGIINISNIGLLNRDDSDFQLNVSGISSNNVNNIKLFPHDSLFIFLKANLSENNEDTLIPHNERIEFSYNTNTDIIDIVAWGQDAFRVQEHEIATTTWSSSKPYIILDSLVIKEGHTLTITSGVHVHLHNTANIIVKGNLVINGTLDEPVIIASDRLEYKYHDIPGQWGSIIFDSTSTENRIEHAEIKHATNGLLVRSGNTSPVALEIINSKITICNSVGLYTENATVESYNTIIGNCESSCIEAYGGEYNLRHMTIANYDNIFNYSRPVVSIKQSEQEDEVMIFNCQNSIIYSGRSKPMYIDSAFTNNTLTANIDFCLFDHSVSDFSADETSYLGDSIVFWDNSDLPLFELSGGEFSYELDSLSIARGKAQIEISRQIPFDIEGTDRFEDNDPDIGALEYIFKEETEED